MFRDTGQYTRKYQCAKIVVLTEHVEIQSENRYPQPPSMLERAWIICPLFLHEFDASTVTRHILLSVLSKSLNCCLIGPFACHSKIDEYLKKGEKIKKKGRKKEECGKKEKGKMAETKSGFTWKNWTIRNRLWKWQRFSLLF